MKSSFGWTVILASGGDIIVYKRDTPADKANYAADLAPFTFPTKAEAIAAGKRGHYAYRREK